MQFKPSPKAIYTETLALSRAWNEKYNCDPSPEARANFFVSTPQLGYAGMMIPRAILFQREDSKRLSLSCASRCKISMVKHSPFLPFALWLKLNSREQSQFATESCLLWNSGVVGIAFLSKLWALPWLEKTCVIHIARPGWTSAFHVSWGIPPIPLAGVGIGQSWLDMPTHHRDWYGYTDYYRLL